MDFNSETMKGAHVSFALAARLVQQEPDEAWVRTCIGQDLFGAAPFGMADVAEGAAAIRREWLRLFVGLGTPEAPVWEAVYTEPEATMRGRSTLAVRAAYRAWGLEFERKAHEPEDALGLMLAFCSFLMEREIKALEEGDEATAAKAASSLEAFMAEHMLPWASAWRFLVQNHAKTDYYRGVGELVFGLERAYARRFGITCDPEDGTFSYAAGA